MRDHVELYDLLPHRHPILLVDRVVDGEPGGWIETIKALTAAEPCFAGLGQGQPARAYGYPPTLILESFVQSAGALWAWTARADGAAHTGTLVLAGARGVRYHRRAQPGDTLRHRVTLVRRVGSNAFLTGTTTDATTGETVCEVDSVVLAKRPSGVIGEAR